MQHFNIDLANENIVINDSDIDPTGFNVVELENEETISDFEKAEIGDLDFDHHVIDNPIFVRFAGYTCNMDEQELADYAFYSNAKSGMVFQRIKI